MPTKLIAEEVNVYRGHDGTVLSLRLAEESVPKIYADLDKFRDGKKLDVELKKHRGCRSLEANAYAWSLIDKLAVALGMPSTHIYHQVVLDVGGNVVRSLVPNESVATETLDWTSKGLGWLAFAEPSSKFPGHTVLTKYRGTSTFDTAQMARFIDLLVQECVQQDIPTCRPEEHEAMLKEYAAYENASSKKM